MSYPSVFSSFNRPAASDKLNSPSHSALHNTVSSALGQVEQFIGLSTSSAVGSLVYDIRSPDSNGGGHVQTANKGGTGQTSFTKGDLLVATSTSVLTKLAVGGTNGLALIVDSSTSTGVTWGTPNSQPTIRVYDPADSGGSGTSFLGIWTKPSTISYAVIECVGGGGAGDDAGGGTGGSGGGGAYTKKVVPAASLPQAASIIIGRGGSASVAGSTTRFGSVLTAVGGSPGSGANAGAGGVATGGDANFDGQAGKAGNAGGPLGFSAAGGDSFIGSGGIGVATGAGGAGVRGGGGAAGHDTAGGGTGGAGLIIITEY